MTNQITCSFAGIIE